MNLGELTPDLKVLIDAEIESAAPPGTLPSPTDEGDVLTVVSGDWAGAPGGGAPPGVPVVYGPYPVDFTDFAGTAYLDPLTLFVPTVGDHVLGVWIDPNTAVEFDADASGLGIGQNLDFDVLPNGWLGAGTGIAPGDNPKFPSGRNPTTGSFWQTPAYASVPWAQPQIVIATTDPVVAAWDPAGPPMTPPSQGHWDVYFMIATPVAP